MHALLYGRCKREVPCPTRIGKPLLWLLAQCRCSAKKQNAGADKAGTKKANTHVVLLVRLVSVRLRGVIIGVAPLYQGGRGVSAAARTFPFSGT